MNIFEKDGNIIQVYTMDHLKDYIGEKLGGDTVLALDILNQDYQDSLNNVEDELNAMYDSNHNLERALIDGYDAFEELENYILDSKRINRNKLLELIKDIKGIIDTDNIDY